ncbi:Ger(x)C family spore germination protein [Ureibacillus chungkukjangi]|uniref:Ger(x)C family spore germination protein n=1 Tax=Ureibacillus chungkukjangi TaxID=1202712 RepID=UPI00203FBED4|nr:Ger(x)C family spore germination protein [Ureibacillus chungkukjangi]MCM3389872.1 Ger(x)C family spore germination protein [Ureibacillus chungkukjangi]
MSRKSISLYLLIASISFLSGCWSQKELNELAIISAMSIDKNEDGQYIKTIQLINPSNVAGGLQGGGGGQSPAVTVYTATGDSVLEAHFNASSKISRKLYHAHANLIVLSEEVAKEDGLENVLDAFEREPEIRSTTRLVIAHNTKAGDLLKSLTGVDKIPAEKVNGTLEFTEQSRGANMEVSLQDVIKVLTAEGKEPVISGFSMKGDIEKGKKMENIQKSELDTTLEADGLAIFKEGKLIDWYQDDMAKGVLWVLDKIKETDVELDRDGKKNVIVYNVFRQRTKVSADTKNDIPTITINVRAEGDIREVRTQINLNDPKVILELEKELENNIKTLLEETIKRTQQNQTDIFGFGEEVHRSNPKKWKNMKNDWNNNYFPNLNVQVNVEAFVRRSGLRSNSFFSDMKD